MERAEAEAIYAAGRERCLELILELARRCEQLEERVRRLEEQSRQSSRTSSKPPSSDPPKTRQQRWASALDVEATVELMLELDQAANREERLAVLVAVEGGEHAGVVVDRGDRGTQTVAEGLAHRAAAEVVVPAGARRLFLECEPEPTQVLLPGGGDDVDPVGQLVASVDHPGPTRAR